MATHLNAPLLFTLFLSILSTGISDLWSDRAALLHLSSAVGGTTLRWNTSHPTPCSWEGVICNTTSNRITGLHLPSARLTGQIPPNTIGNLTQLRVLSLRFNFLSGALPSDIGSCTQLRNLYLQQNAFSGEIPPTIFNLSNLVRLNLARNRISRSISPLFGNLTRLGSLNLETNLLSGSLPSALILPNLRTFNVSDNNLTNSIPENLANFPASSFLGNFLCGSPLDPCTRS